MFISHRDCALIKLKLFTLSTTTRTFCDNVQEIYFSRDFLTFMLNIFLRKHALFQNFRWENLCLPDSLFVILYLSYTSFRQDCRYLFETYFAKFSYLVNFVEKYFEVETFAEFSIISSVCIFPGESHKIYKIY